MNEKGLILHIMQRMILLCLERGAYLRVRKGVKKCDIEREFSFPVNAEVYAGAIIPVLPEPGGYCYAIAGDSYSTIAKREGADVEELKKLNGDAPLYPTKKIWLP